MQERECIVCGRTLPDTAEYFAPGCDPGPAPCRECVAAAVSAKQEHDREYQHRYYQENLPRIRKQRCLHAQRSMRVAYPSQANRGLVLRTIAQQDGRCWSCARWLGGRELRLLTMKHTVFVCCKECAWVIGMESPVERWRTDTGLTRTQLADAAAIPERELAAVENGDAEMPRQLISLLEHDLPWSLPDVDVEELAEKQSRFIEIKAWLNRRMGP